MSPTLCNHSFLQAPEVGISRCVIPMHPVLLSILSSALTVIISLPLWLWFWWKYAPVPPAPVAYQPPPPAPPVAVPQLVPAPPPPPSPFPPLPPPPDILSPQLFPVAQYPPPYTNTSPDKPPPLYKLDTRVIDNCYQRSAYVLVSADLAFTVAPASLEPWRFDPERSPSKAFDTAITIQSGNLLKHLSTCVDMLEELPLRLSAVTNLSLSRANV